MTDKITRMDLSYLPTSPGIYIFRDINKKVLYVGKAINLKNRVSSYFAYPDTLTPKTKALVSKIKKVDYVKTENEVEALILEADLIKQYHPPYNINLKDDKYYKFIKIEKNKIKISENNLSDLQWIFRITTSRKKTNFNDIFLGPYPDSTSVNLILKTLRKIFPYRDCSIAKFSRYSKLKKPCLYGHIGLCPAPCQSKINVDTNNQNINQIKEYIRGDRKELFNELRRKMAEYSRNEEFEKAAVLRDQIQSYEYLTQNIRDVKEYIEVPNLIDEKNILSQEELKNILTNKVGFKFKQNNSNNDLNDDFRIEIFDISNIQGTNPVGSMVVITNGSIDKKNYRRFRIKSKKTPDDFFMMQEMLTRRFKNKSWGNPDLIVIDGGKGQLSSVIEVMNKLNIQIPIVGLAKKFETIIVYRNDEFIEISLPKNSPAINLLMKGRDESHRFAITYHRKLRKQEIFK